MNAAAQPQLLLVGRILVGVLFLVAGIRKFMYTAGTVGYFANLGLPAPELMLWLAIVIEVGGAILLIVGWQAKWVSWLFIVFVVIATLLGHRFWEYDAAQYGNQLNHFLKNLAIIGGLLYVAVQGPGALSMDAKGAAAKAA
ncbi:MAG: DoxX family protein [Pseudomonadota bacterium]